MCFFNESKKLLDKLTTVFIFLFLTVGFLQYCSLTFGNIIISVVQWPTVFLGGVIILYRLINFKQFLTNKNIWLLIAFAISFLFSMLMNFKYGIYENFRAFVFLVFQIGILFAFDAAESVEKFKNNCFLISNYYIIAVAIMSIASFVVMIFGVNILVEGGADSSVPAYAVGFYWGRLFGIYWDPNIGALMAVTTTILSLGYAYKFRERVTLKVLYYVNVFIQVCYITFSGSRSARICLVIGITLLAFLYAIRFAKKIFNLNKVISVILITIIAFTVSYAAPKAINSVYNSYVSTFSEDRSDLMVERNDEVVSTDISNRRFDIWGSAYELYKTSPIYGVSHFNIVPYAEANVPETYIVNNNHLKFNTMHNVFVDVLVSQGTLGILIFVSAVLCIAVSIFNNFKKMLNSEHFDLFAILFTVVVVTVCGSIFMTELVYVITPLTLMFWYVLGGIFAIISKTDK